jgi:hypothetical protein
VAFFALRVRFVAKRSLSLKDGARGRSRGSEDGLASAPRGPKRFQEAPNRAPEGLPIGLNSVKAVPNLGGFLKTSPKEP